MNVFRMFEQPFRDAQALRKLKCYGSSKPQTKILIDTVTASSL